MNMTLNRLPSITWYWLKMNEAHLSDVEYASAAPMTIENEALDAALNDESTTNDVKSSANGGAAADAGTFTVTSTDTDSMADQKSGMGPDMNALVSGAHVPYQVFTARAGKKVASPVRLGFQFADGGRSVNAVTLKAEKNSEMTVIQDFTSSENADAFAEAADPFYPEAKGFAAVQTKLDVEEGAALKLIQVQRLGSGYTFLNDIGGRVSDRGRVELIHIILDGDQTFLGVQIDLAGYKASLRADTAYRVKGDGNLDINYFANHTGKKTECELNADGVLRDRAKKVFRGTIDFKRGSSGSVGNEKEDVLMMDDTVRNQTLPVILCSEEDVVGNHGATIGRLDESVLFYLESRGMSREAVYEMMADARIAKVVHLVKDEKLRAKLDACLGA